jgi:hypothetical protein
MTLVHRIAPLPVPPAGPEAGGTRPADGRVPWRAAGVSLASLGTPIGIGVADPLLGHAVLAIELLAVLAVIATALFGSQALSERAFRLMRWAANRPEPPAPVDTGRRRPPRQGPRRGGGRRGRRPPRRGQVHRRTPVAPRWRPRGSAWPSSPPSS